MDSQGGDTTKEAYRHHARAWRRAGRAASPSVRVGIYVPLRRQSTVCEPAPQTFPRSPEGGRRDRAKHAQVGGRPRVFWAPPPGSSRGLGLADAPGLTGQGPPVLSRAADHASVIEPQRSERANHFRSNDQARNCTIFPWRGGCVASPEPWVPRAKGKRGPAGQYTGGAWFRGHPRGVTALAAPPRCGCAPPVPPFARDGPFSPVDGGSTGGYVPGSQR